MPRDNAMRVLEGAMHLSPALGNRMVATKLGNHSVFVRELLPQDMKFDIEHLTSEEAVKVAWYLASVVGKAHGRQMDKATRKEWQATLARNHTKTLDAPSWLWASIIELMMTHEAAYLEHCRRYAVEEKNLRPQPERSNLYFAGAVSTSGEGEAAFCAAGATAWAAAAGAGSVTTQPPPRLL